MSHRSTITFPAQRRVVITGLGLVSPLGNSVEAFWTGLCSGANGLSPLEHEADIGPRYGGIAREFTGHIDDFGELPADQRKQIRKSLKLMNRETQMSVAAAQQALRDSGLSGSGYDPERIGVSFGASHVGIRAEDFRSGVDACRGPDDVPSLDDWGEKGIGEVHPLWLLTCLPNMPSCYVAMYNDLRGPNNTITLGDASTNLAVDEAVAAIREDTVDAMVVGGCGNNLDPCCIMHSLFEHDMAPAESDPQTVLRPFDRHRCGALPAEGAGVLVLEELASATARGAQIYGEVVSGGSSCVVRRNRPQPQHAAANAIEWTLRDGELMPERLGHIQAHGLSSRGIDAAEAQAVVTVLGESGSQVPVTAAKSHFGNAGAGSAALELIAGILALQHGHLFAIRNCEELDDDCPIDAVVSDDREAGESFLTLSLTPQGQATACAIRSAA